MKIVLLASGNGSNVQAIIDRVQSGILNVEIALLVSDNPDAYALQRAAAAKIPTLIVRRSDYDRRSAFDQAIVTALLNTGCELVVLAGYMLIIGESFFSAFPDRIINLHPALLPSFPGLHGIRDAWEYGVKLTGASVHFVEREVDAGPLIIQAALPVRESQEDLEARIHAVEHRILPQAIQWFAEGRLTIKGRKVILAPAAKKQANCQDCLIWPPLETGF